MSTTCKNICHTSLLEHIQEKTESEMAITEKMAFKTVEKLAELLLE